MDSIPEKIEVAVVGAGLAGLAAARRLARAGARVHLFEPNEAVGGRVRTEVVDGHLCDLGFQVLLTGYPAVQEEFDLPALNLCRFEPGTVVVRDGRHYSLPDPFRTPHRWLEALAYPLATLADKWKTRSLRNQLRRQDLESVFSAPEQMAAAWLRNQGFSERFLSTFWIPFFSAVFLDPPLEVTSRMFTFVFRSIALGDIAIPAGGMGALPAQIAADLRPESIHLCTRAVSLRVQHGAVRGLLVASSNDPKTPAREIEAEAVILACGPEEARRLSGLPVPNLEPLGVSVVYFQTDVPVTSERRIFLNGGGSGPGHHVVFLSNICPSYAPAGSQLISVTILGVPEAEGSTLAERVRRQMAVWFPGGHTADWRWLATYKVPVAQFRQPPGLLGRLPGPVTTVRGLYLAGDYTRHSSLEGALESGQLAARALLSP